MSIQDLSKYGIEFKPGLFDLFVKVCVVVMPCHFANQQLSNLTQ